MNDVFALALSFARKWEGRYVNHPSDPGGKTNFGITQAVYNSWRISQGLAPLDVRLISQQEVSEIYYQNYWQPARCELMVKPLAVVQFDTAVNFGVAGAIMFLQEAIHATPIDGIWEPITQGKLERNNTQLTAQKIIQGRKDYRYQRVRQAPSQRVFLQGWLNRDNDLERFIRGL
ncbi:MAG: glycosyl hydrolase 108 family protein [Gloeomargarita sp. HHBFW_bins_162]